jgi:hypothetical protein
MKRSIAWSTRVSPIFSALAVAGLLGFAGTWWEAIIRSRAGERLASPALIADGDHARADAYVSLAVVASAAAVAVGAEVADPLIGLAITLVILRITWQSWQTVRAYDGHLHDHPPSTLTPPSDHRAARPVLLLAVRLAYVRRSAALAARGQPVPWWRQLGFALGLLILPVTDVPSLSGLAEERIVVHMA